MKSRNSLNLFANILAEQRVITYNTRGRNPDDTAVRKQQLKANLSAGIKMPPGKKSKALADAYSTAREEMSRRDREVRECYDKFCHCVNQLETSPGDDLGKDRNNSRQ